MAARPSTSIGALGCMLGMTALVLAGCVEPDPAPVEPTLASLLPAVLDKETVRLDVPVPVVLVGFEAGTGAALQAKLPPFEVAHEHYNFAFEFPPQLVLASGAASPNAPLAIHPTADFQVLEAPAAFADDLAAKLAASAKGGLWSANQAEELLATGLAELGHQFDPSAPTLVLLHLGSPGYRYQQTNGYLDGVRVFGERLPFLVLDTSAPVDPFSGDERPYQSPLAGGPKDAPVLAEAARDAATFRLLQGPIYPVSTATCHAVSLVIGVRAASLAEVLDGPYADAVDVPLLQGAWENATGGTVHIDLEPLLLPADDPGLDAALRSASAGTPGGLDVLRQWAAMNWEQYWVPHEGCEPYVSFLIVGDAGDQNLFGIAMYDVAEGHRVSLSVVPDLVRLQEGDGPTSILGGRPASREKPDWGTFLFAHETGHLLGQRHPHDVSFAGGDGDFTFAWSSVWSSMTYESGDRLVDFGAIDQNNHLRNRAATALAEAFADDKTVSPDVLQLLGERKWEQATQALRAS